MKEVETEEAETKNDKILEEFGQNYENKWQIVVQEPLQNSADGQGENIIKGVIPEDRVVNAEMRIYPDENAVEYTDKGVGGMKPEVLGDVVTKIADSTKDESGSGGGSFGIGLWMMTLVTDGGRMYIESSHEGENESSATILYPDGERLKTEGKNKYGEPEEIINKANININKEVPREWEEGGTLLRLENISDSVMEVLCDYEKVEEEIQDNFPTLGENFNFSWHIDGEENVYNPPMWDDIIDEVVRKEENVNIKREKDGCVIDEIVFFKVDGEVPWGGNIPLMKTRSFFENPYLIVDDYIPQDASSITSPNGAVSAFAVVDTACDEYNLEDSTHNEITFDYSRTGMGDIASEVHRQVIINNVSERSISEGDAKNAAMNGIKEVSNLMREETDGDMEEVYGVSYDPEGSLDISPIRDKETVCIEVESKIKENAINPSDEYTIYLEVTHQETGDIIGSKSLEGIELENCYSKTIEWHTDREGSFLIQGKLIDEDIGKICDENGTMLGLNKNTLPEKHREGGGAETQARQNQEVVDENISMESMNIKNVNYVEGDTDGDFIVHSPDGRCDDWSLDINIKSDEWVNLASLGKKNVREERQKHLAKKKAAMKIIDAMMFYSDSNDSRTLSEFQSLKTKVKNNIEQEN